MSPHRSPRAHALARAVLLACLGGALGAPAAQAAPAAAATRHFDLPAASLDSALNALGRQSGLLIAFTPEQVAGHRAPALRGDYTAAQALDALLAGSGLAAQAQGENAFVLRPAPPAATAAPATAPAATAAPDATTLPTLTVVGDWLGVARQDDVFAHPGARDVLRREDFERAGATTPREALNRIAGVEAPENNGTGSHDLALNFGIRGLNPRLATRSTVLMDGIPVPFAPYGQPQLSLASLSLGNMDAVDVVRGGGAVRYGPQNVGGIVNFVTRAIPQDFAIKGGYQIENSPSSSHDGFKRTGNLLIGGTADNGLGGALLYSGTRGSDYREHSGTRIDDVILKGHYQLDEANSFHALGQYYDGEADMPGGLTRTEYAADPYQSTRFTDRFWGRRSVYGAGYDYASGQRRFSANGFYTQTLRSGYLDQGSFVSLSPRYYWVRGLEARFSQGFSTGAIEHELGVGYRYVNEASHELRYRETLASGLLPTTSSRNDRDTRGQTKAHALYADDRIDLGRWTLTPGIRYEIIDQQQLNVLTATPYKGDYRTALPALNVLYRLDAHWNLYANTEGSFGSVQYSQMPNRVAIDAIKPEKARTWELGTRYDDGALQAEIGAFLIDFDHQYDSSQTSDSVIARGKTRHQGIESSLAYQLSALAPALAGLDVHANYAFTDATIREAGLNQGNQVPFSSRHKGLAGVGYSRGSWRLDLETQFQSAQFADNENTVAESADGSTGRIPGYAVWNARAGYDFGPGMSDLRLGFGIKNLFDRAYFTRSYDDNNKGKYLGIPRTFYVQVSMGF